VSLQRDLTVLVFNVPRRNCHGSHQKRQR
jgi:hypothetical protein